jgi:hypothetical protein
VPIIMNFKRCVSFSLRDCNFFITNVFM